MQTRIQKYLQGILILNNMIKIITFIDIFHVNKKHFTWIFFLNCNPPPQKKKQRRLGHNNKQYFLFIFFKCFIKIISLIFFKVFCSGFTCILSFMCVVKGYFHLWAIPKEDVMYRVCFQNELYITGTRSFQRYVPMSRRIWLHYDFDIC